VNCRIPMARDVKLIRCHGNKTHEIGKALKLGSWTTDRENHSLLLAEYESIYI